MTTLTRKASLVAGLTCSLVISLAAHGAIGRDTEPSARVPTDELAHTAQVLIGRCMRNAGFRYVVAPPSAQPDVPPNAFRYGIDDVAWAEANGFGIGAADEAGRRAEKQRSRDPNMRYVASLAPERQDAFQRALVGGPDDPAVTVVVAGKFTVSGSTHGCTAAAEQQMYGDFATWFRASTVAENLGAEVGPRVAQDARYQDALARWSACMTELGQTAASPADLRRRLMERAGSLPADLRRPEERRLAVDEARCVRRTGLVSTALELEGRHTAEVRALLQDELRAVDEMRLRAVGRTAG